MHPDETLYENYYNRELLVKQYLFGFESSPVFLDNQRGQGDLFHSDLLFEMFHV